jgi:predicted nucleic acid-binding protein
MTAPVFVDTNVFIYARDAGDPAKQLPAAQWLEHLWREQLGRTSTQVLSEYYVNVTRKLKPGLAPEEAWDDVQALLTWRPQPIDAGLLARGREVEQRYRLSWWDSLVVAAAQVQGCAVLLSEDLKDGGVYGGVTVRSPFTLACEEAGSAYEVGARAVQRHPPRGRPKRPAARTESSRRRRV